MRNQLFLSFALLLTLVIFSCQEKEQKEKSSDKTTTKNQASQADDSLPTTQDTIHVSTFNKWTKNWSDGGAEWIAHNKLDGFNLPIMDLKNVVAEDPSGSRFYLGLEYLKGDPGSFSTPGNYEAKLIVVAVNSSNEDLNNPDLGQYYYDVSNPCPPCTGGGGNQ